MLMDKKAKTTVLIPKIFFSLMTVVMSYDYSGISVLGLKKPDPGPVPGRIH
jgi:hypothetical protein